MKKHKKLLENNTFLVNSSACIVIMLLICYFGINTSVKKTYSASDVFYTVDGEKIELPDEDEREVRGEYKWVTDMTKEERTVNLKFRKKGFLFEYTGIRMLQSIIPAWSFQYNSSGSYETVYKYVAAQSNWIDVNQDSIGWSGSNGIIYVSELQQLSSTDYTWFTNNADPINRCYYNDVAKAFVWTNVDVGVEVSSATSYNECMQKIRISISTDRGEISEDYNNGAYVNILGQTTAGYFNRGDSFNLESLGNSYRKLTFYAKGYKVTGIKFVDSNNVLQKFKI